MLENCGVRRRPLRPYFLHSFMWDRPSHLDPVVHLQLGSIDALDDVFNHAEFLPGIDPDAVGRLSNNVVLNSDA